MNHFKQSHRPFLLTLMLGVLLAGTGPAHAGQDTKRWSGALCVPYGSTPQTDYAVRGDGIQNNSASFDRWVVCALTRDSEEAFNLQGSASVEIRGTRAGAGSIDCMLTKGNLAMPPMANLVQPVPYGTGNWTAIFPAAALQSDASATLAVTCRLPPKAQLNHLRYAESTDTDYSDNNP